MSSHVFILLNIVVNDVCCELGVQVRDKVSCYQSERSQDRESLYIGEAQLHQTEANNDTIKNVPALLEIIIGVQGNQLQCHLSCKDPCKNLGNTRKKRLGSEKGGKNSKATITDQTHKRYRCQQSYW